jgi:hypothetical protein
VAVSFLRFIDIALKEEFGSYLAVEQSIQPLLAGSRLSRDFAEKYFHQLVSFHVSAGDNADNLSFACPTSSSGGHGRSASSLCNNSISFDEKFDCFRDLS